MNACRAVLPEICEQPWNRGRVAPALAIVTLLVLSASLPAPALSVCVEWSVQNGGNGHCYQAVHVPAGITWQDAQDAAFAAGGHLATIGSAEENAFIFGLAAADSSLWNFTANAEGPWLGGFQPAGSPEPAGGWQWVTGEPWSYTNWTGSEPNNFNGVEDRLHFFGAPGPQIGPGWNDAPSFLGLLGYVVEFPGPVPVEGSSFGAIKGAYR